MKRNIHQYIFTVLFAIPSLVFAQEPTGGQLDDAEVIIEKSSDLVLPQVQKPLDKMVKKKRAEESQPQIYQLKLLPVDLNALEVKQEAYATTPEPDTFNSDGGYAALGLGFPLATRAHVFYQQHLNENIQLGGTLLHNGLYQGPVENNLSGNQKNRFGAFGNFKFGKDLLKINTSYNQKMVHYYGLREEELAHVEKDSIKQTYNHFDFNASYEINADQDDWGLTPSVNFYTLSDHYNSQETYLNLRIGGNYKLSKKSRLVGGIDFNNTSFKNENWDRNRGFVKATAAYEQQGKQFSYHIGGRIVYDLDTISQVRTFNIYPDITAQYQVSEKVFFDAKIVGDLEEMNLRSIAQINPFTSHTTNIINENKLVQIEVASHFAPMQHTNIRVGIGHSLYKNMGFYVNDLQNPSTFLLQYSEENTGITYFGLGIETLPNPEIIISADLQYNLYAVDENIGEAWHKPALEGDFQIQYTGVENFKFTAGAYLYTGMLALDLQEAATVTVELDPIFDLYLRSDYQVNEQLSAYIQLNNITGQKYQYFYNYEQLGFNMMLGAQIRF